MFTVIETDTFSGTVDVSYFDKKEDAQIYYDDCVLENDFESNISDPTNLGIYLMEVLQQIPHKTYD